MIAADLPPLHLPRLLQGGAVVYSSVFDHRQKDEQEAGPQVDVHCFYIRHLSQKEAQRGKTWALRYTYPAPKVYI